MIVFHEGLPGAGKSYEACVYHIIPALQSGRVVITNIEGINHEKFSEHTGIPVPVLRKMLICIYHEEILDVEQRHEAQLNDFLRSANDSMLVIDEIQNLHPATRQKLGADWSKFITEHRHNGLDIILMGQDRRDCHPLWRRRIQRLITFTKQTAIGRDGHYLWRAHEATKAETYNLISSGSRSYDPKFFGLYASHTTETTNKSVYADKRVNIFKTALFTFTIPATLLVSGISIWYLISFFNDPSKVSGQQKAPIERSEIAASADVKKSLAALPQPVPSTKAVAATTPVPVAIPDTLDTFDKLSQDYRARLAGIVQNGSKITVKVDFLDKTMHVQDSFDIRAIHALGWSTRFDAAGLHVSKGGKQMLIRAWPIDMYGKVDNYRTEAL